MEKSQKTIKLLFVDDEADFRSATGKALSRRGFSVIEAGSGEDALVLVKSAQPDIILLDLKMVGMSGIETLKKIRGFNRTVPVIILTGHGSFHDALAGINLEIVDFMQKPVDVELLEKRIRRFVEGGAKQILHESTVGEIMVSPSIYPKIYTDESVRELVGRFHEIYRENSIDDLGHTGIRSALVYGRDETFAGIVRFSDIIQRTVPAFLANSPYSSYFTGMFLAQCKIMGDFAVGEILGECVAVDIDAPLMEAVNVMRSKRLNTVPILHEKKLAGILREKDIVLELARYIG